MNQKEVREIKKRLNPEKDSISRIYGCYVNAAKEIVTTLDMSVGLMEQEEAELYFKLLKKNAFRHPRQEPVRHCVQHCAGRKQ